MHMTAAVRVGARSVVASAAAAPEPSRVGRPASHTAQQPQLISSRRQLINTAGLFGAGVACACCPLPAWAEEPVVGTPALPEAAPALAAPSPPPAWGYSCLSGPEKWSGTCATTGFQSPIALTYDSAFPPAGDAGLDILYPLFPRYIKDGVTVENTGHGTMKVRCAALRGRGRGRGS